MVASVVRAFRSNYHLVRLVAQAFAQPREVVFSYIVVLIEDRYLCRRKILEDKAGVDARRIRVAWLPSHGPRIVFAIIPFTSAGSYEQLRHLLFVEVFSDC